MGRADFHDRLARIEQTERRAIRATQGFTWTAWIIALAMIPVGHIARLSLHDFLDGRWTIGTLEHSAIYGALIAFHVFMVIGMVSGIFYRGRRPYRTLAALGALIGYAAGGVTLASI